MLRYLGEEFSRAECKGTCDICSSGGEVEKRDVTTTANRLLKLMNSLNDKYTVNHVVDVFRGSKKKKIVQLHQDKLPNWGAGKSLPAVGLFLKLYLSIDLDYYE